MFAFRMHMDGISFTLAGQTLTARPGGALWCAAHRWLCVSDLHLGKSDRIARAGGALLPPYDIAETLGRLEAEIEALTPVRVICLGDSFDDGAASHALRPAARERLLVMMAGRSWHWVTGNHDPGPPDIPGMVHDELRIGPLILRHETRKEACGEISGHFHPKFSVTLGGRRLSRPAFLLDARRVILPAFGAYTGGLDAGHPTLCRLMEPGARAILTGRVMLSVPMASGRSPQRAGSRAAR